MATAFPRMTLSTQAVLLALISSPTEDRYGLELSAATGVPTGTLHPILARLERLGWVESFWEEIDVRTEGRPRRRYYRLSSDGLELAREALARTSRERLRITTRYRPLGQTP